MKIGVIGLGMMGMNIARNFIARGYETYGYDIDAQKGNILSQIGGIACASCAEVASKTSTIVLMVFNAQNLDQVLFGEDSLLETASEGSNYIVTATLGADVMEKVAPVLESKKIGWIDAPLMASSDDAAAGTMHMMVSGCKEDISAVRNVLDDMSSTLYFMGEKPGMAQKAKICLQALFSLTFEAAFEIDTLAARCGINMDELHRLFADSPSASVLLKISEQNIEKRTFTGTNNPLTILDKDAKLALELAEKYGIKLPAVAGCASNFSRAMQKYPKEDIFAAVKTIENS